MKITLKTPSLAVLYVVGIVMIPNLISLIGFQVSAQTNNISTNNSQIDQLTFQQKEAIHQTEADVQKAAAERKQIALRQSAYTQGYNVGKDYKETSGGAIFDVNRIWEISMQHHYPKLENYPDLKEAFHQGFVIGYNNATSYSQLYQDQPATITPIANQNQLQDHAKVPVKAPVEQPRYSTGTAQGVGDTKADAYVKAMGNLPIKAEQTGTDYSRIGGVGGYVCQIHYKKKQ